MSIKLTIKLLSYLLDITLINALIICIIFDNIFGKSSWGCKWKWESKNSALELLTRTPVAPRCGKALAPHCPWVISSD